MNKKSEFERGYIYAVGILFVISLIGWCMFFWSCIDVNITKNKTLVICGNITIDYCDGAVCIIKFDDSRYISFHGSPNARYDTLDFELLEQGAMYTFVYHREEVMGDGNTEFWFMGNVIDNIHRGNQTWYYE